MQVFYLKVINICKIYRKSSTNFAECNATRKFISIISVMIHPHLCLAKSAVRWQMIFTTFRHVVWVVVKRLTALKT